MRKILIIGAKGMLGQELVKVFSADKNYEVFGWDRLSMSDINSIDITDEAQVKDKVLKLAPEIIIDAAAYNAVDKCEELEEFELAKKLNGLAPKFLAQTAKNLGAIFVHKRTPYIFNGEKKEGYLENDKPSPISNYGISKLIGEQEVTRVGGKYFIIRLQKLFGRTGIDAGAKKSFFETMLALAQTKKELEVVDEELANFTYAPDLAERTKWLIENVKENPSTLSPPRRGLRSGNNLYPEFVEGCPYGIYHITNEGAPATWFGAAKILFEMTRQRHPDPAVAGSGYSVNAVRHKVGDFSVTPQNDNMPKLIPVMSAKFPRSAKRPKYSILLNTKLSPLRPWTEALKDFLKKRYENV